MKPCTKCGEIKPYSDFSKSAGRRDGLQCHCKACVKTDSAKWYLLNKERVKSNTAKWLEKNSDRKKATTEMWRRANQEKVNAQAVVRYAANIERAREVKAKWRASNPDAVKAIIAKWRARNPDKVNTARKARYAVRSDSIRAANARWRKANPAIIRTLNQNYRARKRNNGGRLSKNIAEHLFSLQRGKCACGCGQQLGNDYHLDHVLPLALGGVNEDGNIQLMRARCNLQKGAQHPIKFMQQRGYLL